LTIVSQECIPVVSVCVPRWW